MKKIITISVIALLIAGMIFLLFNNRRKIKAQTAGLSSENIVSVETSAVKEKSYSFDCTSNGLLQAGTDLNFVSDVSGRVVRIFVDKGSRVRKGTVLLKVDSEMLEADYEAAAAAYEALKKDEERFSKSNEAGGISEQQLDNIRTQLTAAKSRMEVSRRRLADATVKSPMDGVINMKFIDLGSLIAPNVPLFEIVDDRTLKVTCSLPESKIAGLSAGQGVTVTSSDAPGQVFSGTVSNIGVKTDSGLNYPVEVTMNKDKGLRIGMYMKVHFITDETRNGIMVSRNSIVGSAKSAEVFILENGTAVQKEVTLGRMAGDSVEVLSGLRDGDLLITSGLMNVSDGVKVKSIN